MSLSLRKDQLELSSLIITSLLLSSGFNKMLLPSHWPSWGLQSDVTLIDIGLQALEVPIKARLMLLLYWFRCVNLNLFVSHAVSHFLTQFSCHPVHFEERLTILYPVNKSFPAGCGGLIIHTPCICTAHTLMGIPPAGSFID